jgi:hypothetical protein
MGNKKAQNAKSKYQNLNKNSKTINKLKSQNANGKSTWQMLKLFKA